jgi:hypothetical protein
MVPEVEAREPNNEPAPSVPLGPAEKRFIGVALALVLLYFGLALTHGGEFWPFSRFPMFANARKPWLRATLRELRAEDLDTPLSEVGERDVPGLRFPLAELGIDQNDLSEVVKRAGDTLEPEDLALFAQYFPDVGARTLILYGVRGRLRSDSTVRVRYRPVAMLHGEHVTAVVGTPSARQMGAP